MASAAFDFARRRAPCCFLIALVAGACGSATSSAKGRPQPSATASPRVGASPPAVPVGPSTAQRPAQAAAPVESNPPGDIPDNVAYVAYRNVVGRYTFDHPEGWARIVSGPSATFTDKLNGITATGMPATSAPTLAGARQDLPRLRASQAAFEFRTMKTISLPGGSGVLVVFRRNSAPDPVTGKVFRDEVQRYEIYRPGRVVVLDLYGAVGSDNVDPYTKISRSLRLS